jgi:hypothetical protein
MNREEARKEIFALMLALEECEDLNEILSIQWKIEEKTRALADVVQLDFHTVEILLARQYAEWLRNVGGENHETDEL